MRSWKFSLESTVRGLRWLVVACGLALLTACGSSGGQSPYDAGRSVPSLNAAGWQARQALGMPRTVAGVHQAGFLDARSPSGREASLQFLDDASSASKELHAIRSHQPSFGGTTVGNVLVATSLPASDLASLRAHLRS